jgi:hypothetical protein
VTSRYSSRLSWTLSVNPFSAALSAQRLAGTPLLDLTVSNPTAAALAYPHDEMSRALGSIPKFFYEPDPAGSIEARMAISGYYAGRGLSVAVDRILLTASTSEAYSYLFKLLCDPGDEILVPLPSYPLFEYLAKLEGVRVVPYWLRYDGTWHLDFSTLVAALSNRSRAIVVVNPNNPTGSFLKKAELTRLMELAEDRNLPVIADEVFSDYALAKSETSVATLVNTIGPLSFSLSGLSKSAAMPQMKLGWIVINGSQALREECRERLELILDTYLSPAMPVQAALPRLLVAGGGLRGQIQRRIRQNVRALQTIFTGSAAGVLHVEAGWSAIIQIPRTKSEEDWALELLHERSVVVQPGYFYDMPGEAYLVLSLLTDPDVLQEGAGRIREAVSRG